MAMNRKDFLKLSAQSVLGAMALGSPGWPRASLFEEASAAEPHPSPSGPRPRKSQAVLADPAGPRDLLVHVFLRGGADGLNIVLPISGDDRAIYEAARPGLKIPISGEKAALKLDDRFGLHPSGKPFFDLFQSQKLAVIHASGLTSDTRSHFDAQAYMELGTPKNKGTSSGWMTRYLHNVVPTDARDSFTAVTIGNLPPTSLLAFEQAAVINQLNGFNLGGPGKERGDEFKALHRMYAAAGAAPGAWISEYGEEALDAIHRIESQLGGGPGGNPKDQNGPSVTGDYPKNDLGNRLKTLAQLVRMNLGIQVATVDMGGWDTHKYQNNGSDGHLAGQIDQLTQAVSVFYQEMLQISHPVTIIVQSEFGRRLKENANKGTDHGHGNVMFVLGEHVNGGKVYGQWPGLKTENLYERADLAVTTDYRQVVTEILQRRLGARNPHGIFPGYTGYRPLGLIKA